MTVADKQEINSPDLEAYQAMKLLEAGENQAAMQRCVEAIERFGDSRNCYLVMARVHIEEEEYGFAEEALKNVLQLDPEHPAAWAMMGEIYFRLGNETRVEYCRSRLESIFPAITESFTQRNAETEVQNAAVDSESSGNIDTEPEGDSIVPLENIEGDEMEPETFVDSSIEPGQVALDRSENKTGEVVEKKGGLKSELFETATFADICISQGKYDKALAIYNRLLQADPGNMKYIDKINVIKQKWDENESEQVE